MAKFSLNKFDITTISDDSVCVFIGKRRTGKSFLVQDLIYYNRDIPIATVISGTESASPFFSNFVPSLFIHDEYTPELLSNVVHRQTKIKKKIQKYKKRGENVTLDPRSVLILDDCLFDKSWIKDKNIRYMFMNGRHCSTLFLITMQFPLGIPPNLRTNIDYVFILRENNINNRKRIYENYASMFPTFEMFCVVLDQCTENYECLVVQINACSNRLQDQVFWYKAEHHSEFKMGAKEFWDAHYENMNNCGNTDDDDDDEMFDVSQLRKRNHPKINVNKKQ